MCTLIVFHQPGHPWPLLMGANRDELLTRPWKQPGRHWHDHPHVVAGLDELGGGSWFGLNDNGVVASIMNRRNTLGPAPGKRSRGELVLQALMHDAARTSVDALALIDPGSYRAFNLVIADCKNAFWLRHTGAGEHAHIEVRDLPPGLNMITAYDVNDTSSPRIRRYLPLLLAAPVPDPERGDWSAWKSMLASTASDPGIGPLGAMNVVTNYGFGTVSSLLLALPASDRSIIKPVWKFADGRPDLVAFHDVML